MCAMYDDDECAWAKVCESYFFDGGADRSISFLNEPFFIVSHLIFFFVPSLWQMMMLNYLRISSLFGMRASTWW
jgi:uncharacterized membrane protein